MTISIQFHKKIQTANQAFILPVFEGKKIGKNIEGLDTKDASALEKVIKNALSFSGKIGEVLVVPALTGKDYSLIIVVGAGEAKKWDHLSAETFGGHIAGALKKEKVTKAALPGNAIDLVEHVLMGARLGSYGFTKYKAVDSKEETEIALTVLESEKSVKQSYASLENIAMGIEMARDLVNEAPNVLYPESYAAQIKAELKPLGVEIEILDDKKMEKMGMGAIIAVGKGSERKPRMVIMHWRGQSKNTKAKPIALVGKGVTFDTGGISIKPPAGMDEMKMDMGGSAAVVGTIKALALQKAPVDVVGIVGLAENMPSANAYRPGDIITSYAGKTIEVLNTDAEGRLVLADALTYVQEKFDPHTIIDLATLTGAMMVALGNEYCGTFVNNDKCWSGLERAAKESGEKIWRMPLDEAWSQEMKSEVAELRNIGKSRYGGACTAAAFLEFFVDKDRKWAHMDIAGTAWVKTSKPTVPKFGTGFAVRTLYEFVINEA